MNQKISATIQTKNREIGKELERVVHAAGGFRIGDGSERSDLLIFELGDNVDEEFDALESLIASKAVGEVFVTSARQDTDLLLKAMRAGTKEFFPQPIDESNVKTALEAFKQRFQQATTKVPIHNGKVIHMMGAKGGVGTTTVAVNLAMMLAELRNAGSVAMMDLNTVFGEIPLFLSVKPNYHWGQIAKNMNRLDSTFLLKAMAKHSSGVHILPSPSYLNGHPPATPEMMEKLIGAMKRTFDFIIVDGGLSLEGPALKTIAMADQVVLITLLSLPCLRNTKNLLKSLTGVGNIQSDRVRLVINRHLKKSDISIKEAEESVRKEIFWNIPNDYKTSMSAINRGIPLHEVSPRAGITKSMAALTDAIVDGEKQKSPKKGWRMFGR